ncbi:3-methyl-2-oxobutanoate hydroxymethyltransferase [Microbacterium sp. Mu-80]|uniref:3-methyl-2-oxobutanoate hydroxymethyltransferase n=1 Tax=Microbacterium bandirmense TaxID=3122050 RepID=A0ABU8LFZ9_9MICO
MSTHPTPASAARPRVTLGALAAKKAAGEPIVMVTACDFPGAQIVEAAGVDTVLVGDSAAMTVLGYDSTVPVTVDEMIMLTSAVRRGLWAPLLVADLPFGSYEASDELAIATAQRFIKESGADAVKIERGGTTVERARALVAAGIPVVGHVGLTPQTATSLGGYRAQGRTADGALRVIEDALALQDAGCSMLVIEAVPAEVTRAVMPHMQIPVIGIGAGADADGQVLVFHDLLGIYGGSAARFVKRYADLRTEMVAGVSRYAEEVRGGEYPAVEHTYSMRADEAEAFAARAAEGFGFGSR